jgi:predicted nucleotidyltransferase
MTGAPFAAVAASNLGPGLHSVLTESTIALAVSTKAPKPPQRSPVRLLFGDYHLRLLSLLLLRPEQDFHLREIERLSGVPVGPARRELQRFVDAGLVTRRAAGNQVRFKADTSCIVFEELAAMLRKTTGIADPIREALQPFADRIDFAALFGSVAGGREGPRSDVDLLIVGDVDFDTVVAATHPLEARLGRPINPSIFSAAAFRAKHAETGGFVSRVLGAPMIPLLGTRDDLG